MIVSMALLAVNIITAPNPPGSVGLMHLGPIAGL